MNYIDTLSHKILYNNEVFYHLLYSDCCLHLYCYIHISADASFGLLQVFHVKLENLNGTLKCWDYDNKDEDNSPNTLSDKNYQVSSQKFR